MMPLTMDVMKRILHCIFIFAISLSTVLNAQNRYLDEVFTNVTVESDVKYGENYTVIGNVVTPDSAATAVLMLVLE